MKPYWHDAFLALPADLNTSYLTYAEPVSFASQAKPTREQEAHRAVEGFLYCPDSAVFRRRVTNMAQDAAHELHHNTKFYHPSGLLKEIFKNLGSDSIEEEMFYPFRESDSEEDASVKILLQVSKLFGSRKGYHQFGQRMTQEQINLLLPFLQKSNLLNKDSDTFWGMLSLSSKSIPIDKAAPNTPISPKALWNSLPEDYRERIIQHYPVFEPLLLQAQHDFTVSSKKEPSLPDRDLKVVQKIASVLKRLEDGESDD